MADLDDLLDSVSLDDLSGDPGAHPLPAATTVVDGTVVDGTVVDGHHSATPMFHSVLLSTLAKMGKLTPLPINGCLSKAGVNKNSFESELIKSLGALYGEQTLKESLKGRLELEIDEDGMGPLSKALRNEA